MSAQYRPVARLASAVLRAYKRWLSPLLPRACRFSPTCSEYGQLALESHGLIAGTWWTLGRLLRCQPLARGGIDLPPTAARNVELGAVTDLHGTDRGTGAVCPHPGSVPCATAQPHGCER